MPGVLAKSTSTGSRELFTLAVLALAMGIAFGAVEFFGISFALGAFVAGVVLNESELSHRTAHDTLPLLDAFVVLFFCFSWDAIRPPYSAARAVGCISNNIYYFAGECAFILAGLGVVLHIFSEQGRHLVLAGTIISIMINPLIFALLERYLRIYANEMDSIEQQQEVNFPLPTSISNHALLVGYGRLGSLIGAKLLYAKVPMVVVENRRPRVNALREQGINVVLGNAAYDDIIASAGTSTISRFKK